MAIEKYIIDKSDLTKLLKGEDLAIKPTGNIKGFSVEITGNPTNGDMFMAMFPHAKVDNNRYTYCVEVKLEYHSQYDTGLLFDKDWWNAPYKESEE
jgi:hypothetical protein